MSVLFPLSLSLSLSHTRTHARTHARTHTFRDHKQRINVFSRVYLQMFSYPELSVLQTRQKCDHPDHLIIFFTNTSSGAQNSGFMRTFICTAKGSITV